MILCDHCDCGYHLDCLTPPLHAVPEGEWSCARCCARGGALGLTASSMEAGESADEEDGVPEGLPEFFETEHDWEHLARDLRVMAEDEMHFRRWLRAHASSGLREERVRLTR